MTRLAPGRSDDPQTDESVASTSQTTRARTRGPLRTIVRLTLGGFMAMLLAVGLLAATDSPAAQAKTTYLSTTFHKPRYGQTNSAVTNLQTRLVKVGDLKSKYVTGYFGDITRSSVKKFRKSVGMKAGKGKVTKKVWKKLVAKSGKIKTGTSGSKATKGIAAACKVNGRVMCIDKSTHKLRYMVNGKIIKTIDARFGCAVSPTREGIWHVFRKVRHDVSYEYHSAMPLSMYFSGGEAVHYSSDFAARGYAGCSHGCVNIRDKKTLTYIYNRIHIGDRVVVYWS